MLRWAHAAFGERMEKVNDPVPCEVESEGSAMTPSAKAAIATASRGARRCPFTCPPSIARAGGSAPGSSRLPPGPWGRSRVDRGSGRLGLSLARGGGPASWGGGGRRGGVLARVVSAGVGWRRGARVVATAAAVGLRCVPVAAVGGRLPRVAGGRVRGGGVLLIVDPPERDGAVPRRVAPDRIPGVHDPWREPGSTGRTRGRPPP